MPTLEWIGKDKVINHHQDVAYRVLERQYSYSAEGQTEADIGSGNMIIHGDNLVALKALLPQYEGKIKCIYIDPPYNTGNEKWVYNDNVNDPKMKKWLGDVVGREGEDLSRHDKWLCMMYPRLKMLQRLLSDEGAIFISIDENEMCSLRIICDEIFGSNNYISLITRPTGTHTGVTNKTIVGESDYILVYAKKTELSSLEGLPVADTNTSIYDMEDEYGRFLIRSLRRTGGENRREDRPNMYFPIIAPDGSEVYPIGPTGYESRWICNPDGYAYFEKAHRIYWKEVRNGDLTKWQVYQKFYLEDKKRALSNLWDDIEGNKKATREVRELLAGTDMRFDFPKPVKLVERIIQIACNSDGIVLDSFAGSGTTAHAVLNLNKQDSGNRKFILVETEDYAETITAERVKRVIRGYGEGNSAVEGTGGDFSFYELGDVLLLADGNLNESVGVDRIRAYVYFMETKQTIGEKSPEENDYFLGTHNQTAYYFYYEPETVTTLDDSFLATICTRADGYLIYADRLALSADDLRKYNIVFKKIPRDISRL